MKFIEALQKTIIIGDGAMGTLLYSQDITGSIEQANLYAAEQVYEAHLEYVKAGANLIQANTYAANRLKLKNYGLESQVTRINEAGVELAKRAAAHSDGTYVAGTIGGIRDGRSSEWTDEEIDDAILEQTKALLASSPDVMLLETYYDLHELIRAIRLIKEQDASIPIVANVSLGDVGVLHGGILLQDALQRLQSEGADVVGLNCRMGLLKRLHPLKRVIIPTDLLLSAYPNASLPGIRDGRLVYQSNPNYFKSQAVSFRNLGVNLIGGCCGTTPEHIRALKDQLKGKEPIKRQTSNNHYVRSKRLESKDHPVSNQKVPSVIVELDPPKSLSKLDIFVDGAKALTEAGADTITLADNSLATSRVDNVASATLIKQRTSASPLVHIACRDRNLIGMQSHLLGLHALGITDVLAITGDPTKVGDFPGASSVYDLTSFDLISMLKEMNEGFSHSGRSLGVKTNFRVGTAFNPNVSSMEKAVKRLDKKIKLGADFVMTQPVYDVDTLYALKKATAHINVPIYVGIMPLINSRNAEFLHNEVPGITLTKQVRERMQSCGQDVQRGEEEGLQIAKELQQHSLSLFERVYLVTPFLRYHITASLVQDAKAQLSKQQLNTLH
ncbi:LOW QUALITY PROTEIN: 5,10-methylenetetrahydrofolate reductase [Geomicrobium sp. JCM 19037]|nr:LOW QUALITY PROTEIN: 5,10-methylenetetrahydrofolate reductase [Geomicrobium sp. JCM 19037]